MSSCFGYITITYSIEQNSPRKPGLQKSRITQCGNGLAVRYVLCSPSSRVSTDGEMGSKTSSCMAVLLLAEDDDDAAAVVARGRLLFLIDWWRRAMLAGSRTTATTAVDDCQ